MKKLTLVILGCLLILSCKKEGESVDGGTSSSVELTKADEDASYAIGVTFGQQADRYKMTLEDSLVVSEIEKGIRDYLKNPKNNDSYAFGLNIGKQIEGVSKNKILAGQIDKDMMINGFMDYLNNKDLRVNKDSVNVLLDEYYQGLVTKAEARNIDEEKAYMAKKKEESGVVFTESGLGYKIIKEGEGAKPTLGDKVEVRYTGKTLDGEIFDTTEEGAKEPRSFQLRPGALISGWLEGMPLMNKGAKYEFYVPSELAYGKGGKGEILPNQMLIFDIELIDFVEGELQEPTQPTIPQPGVQIQPKEGE